MKIKDHCYNTCKVALGTHYDIKDFSMEDWDELGESMRYFKVNRIMHQMPKSESSTLWVMKLDFKDTEIYAVYDTEYRCVSNVISREFFDE